MANYKETEVAGSEYTRCCEIHIFNPRDRAPNVSFVEQRITTLGDRTLETYAGQIDMPFDPAKEIDVIDPETNEPTGEVVTLADVYQLIYSVYLKEALLRDQHQQAAMEALQIQAEGLAVA